MSAELRAALAEWLSARLARQEVCCRDCEWPRGDGRCGYCAREATSAAALAALLEGGAA